MRPMSPSLLRWSRAALPVGALAALAALAVLASGLAGQSDVQALGGQSLRPYWHVFIAYALAWILVFGWLFSIARRLSRVERKLER